MPDRGPLQEQLVLEALQYADVLTMEQMIGRLPELSWSELFHAVDSLNRQRVIILGRRGFDYEVETKASKRVARIGSNP